MPTAKITPVEGAVGPCPCCGAQGHERGLLTTEAGNVAVEVCAFCLDLALRRNQSYVLQGLCREADSARDRKATQGRQERNIRALL